MPPGRNELLRDGLNGRHVHPAKRRVLVDGLLAHTLHVQLKGGLADHSETTTKYHTATHLIHQSLRQTLGTHVQQVGSNITGERLRFDFIHPQALTPGELQQVEDLINEQIKADLPVSKQETSYDRAIKDGALAFFGERYPDSVTVYSIGSFSKEVCGGPHVDHTGLIGPINIYKQESVGSGRRRLYARFK